MKVKYNFWLFHHGTTSLLVVQITDQEWTLRLSSFLNKEVLQCSQSSCLFSNVKYIKLKSSIIWMSSNFTEISCKSKKKRIVTTCFTSILRFHCHAINTTQKNKLETVQWKKPRKWNVIRDQYINNSSKSQAFVAHSFWVTMYMYLPKCFTYGDAILVDSFGPLKRLLEINKNIWSSFFL